MKCDKLIGRTFDGEVYVLASEAMEAIAELKDEIKRKEAVGQRWFEGCMEARGENVKLKRALWLARAELCRTIDVDRYLRNHRNSWYNENCFTWADACVAMEVKMGKAESKCRAKAEEYK